MQLHVTCGLRAGKTRTIHYVHCTDPIPPGPALGACLATEDSTPQLRVKAQVFVLMNDESAASLVDLQAYLLPVPSGAPT